MWSTSSKDRLRRVYNAIAEAFGLVSRMVVAVPVIVTVCAFVSAQLTGHPLIAATALGALSSLCFAAVVAFTLLASPIRALLYGYRLVLVEVVYTLDAVDPWIVHQVTTIKLRTVRPGLRYIQDRYPAGSAETQGDRAVDGTPRVLHGAEDILGPIRDGMWNHYLISLGRALSARTNHVIKLERTMVHDRGQSRFRFGKTVIDPTGRLVIRVRVPESMWPLAVDAADMIPGTDRSRDARYTIDEADREVRLEVDRPASGHRFELSWRQEPPIQQLGDIAA